MSGKSKNIVIVVLGALLLVVCVSYSWAAVGECSLPGVSKQQLRGPNAVPRRALCPKRLHDSELIAAFVRSFPKKSYVVQRVKAVGRFYLDSLRDEIKDVLRKGCIWETDIRATLKKYVQPGTTVIDAGAHIGTHSILMSQLVGPRGRIYAFEPQAKLFRELVHNLRLNRSRSAIPLRFALGSANRIIEMNSSVPGNEGATSVGRGGDKAELRTLDSFGFTNVSLLKIDVEGFEDHVIDGARQTIERYRPIVLVEIRGGSNIDKAPIAQKKRIWTTIRKLEQLGYRVERISAHDYLAVYEKSKAGSIRLGFSRQIPVSSPRFFGPKGKRGVSPLISAGKKGRLLFGPYEYLPAGSYVVKFWGQAKEKMEIEVDVVSRRGKSVHARIRTHVEPAASPKNLAVVAFTLNRGVADVEYRLLLLSDAHLRLDRVDIVRVVPNR